MNVGYFSCSRCGGVYTYLSPPCRSPTCCGQLAHLLTPNTCGEAIVHLPVVTQCGNLVQVQVGERPHPMTPEHLIQWIGLQTNCGTQYRFLRPGDSPSAQFALVPGETVQAALAYCNLHLLWRTEVED